MCKIYYYLHTIYYDVILYIKLTEKSQINHQDVNNTAQFYKIARSTKHVHYTIDWLTYFDRRNISSFILNR